MAKLAIRQFGCLSDNYGVLVHDPQSGATASIDAPEAAKVEAALAGTGWRLSHILVTHHHDDHVAGVMELKARWNARVFGNGADAARIPGIDVALTPGRDFEFAGRQVSVIDTPGHTVGHIAYHFPEDGLAFTGDTLFALGCGRVFEGTFDQMWGSLSRLKALPPHTQVHCGHEYTEANARFAMTIDPGNRALVDRAAEVKALRAEGRPTLPTTIGRERETNPFLRPDDRAIRSRLGMADASDAEVFAEMRRRKDRF